MAKHLNITIHISGLLSEDKGNYNKKQIGKLKN